MAKKVNITYTNVKPLVEASKEAARLALLAVIPLVIAGLEKGSVDWRGLAVVAAITLLRFVDKALHVEGKLEGNETLIKGLTQF